VIAVNTFGSPVKLEFEGRDDLPIVEDCAHAFGLETNEGPLGGRSKIGVLSFYATKLLGGGEGGAVLTNSPEVSQFVRSARDYSDKLPDAHRMNDKMNDLEASLVLAQLQRLPEMIARREALALRYVELLSASDAAGRVFGLPHVNGRRIWYRFVVELRGGLAQEFMEELRKQGVDADLPVADWRLPGGPSCPMADQAYRSLLSLPLYPSLTEEEQDYVADRLLRICEEKIRA
jgi:dTDP-4-amino-4,6-dideoxygalactose transaminase